MAKKNDTIVLDDDGMKDAELSVLSEIYGKEEAEKIVANVNNGEEEQFDEELQDIIDSAPALDEI